jgi:hypothetical protein
MRIQFSAIRLVVAPTAIILATRRKYNILNFQWEKMPDNQSSPEKAERPQSDLKIDAISTYNTGTSISKYDRISPNPAFRHISTRKGRSTNGRLKYQRAKQIQGLNPRKNRWYLQVLRAYLQPYLQVPAGTHTDTPTGGTHFRYMNTTNYAAPGAEESYNMASSDPRPKRKKKSTPLPRMGAPEGNGHPSYNIKWTRIYSLPEPCPHPLGRRRRAPTITTISHKNTRYRLHAEDDSQCGIEPCYART